MCGHSSCYLSVGLCYCIKMLYIFFDVSATSILNFERNKNKRLLWHAHQSVQVSEKCYFRLIQVTQSADDCMFQFHSDGEKQHLHVW